MLKNIEKPARQFNNFANEYNIHIIWSIYHILDIKMNIKHQVVRQQLKWISDKSNINIRENILRYWEKVKSNHNDLEIYTNLKIFIAES